MFQNNVIVPNSGVKYSELLEQFMSPFMIHFKDYEYVEDIMEFAINAWNMANINILMPNEDAEKAINSIPEKDIGLLKKMIAHKELKYKEFTNFIVDFELKETPVGEDPVLSIITQEEEMFLANMLNTIEEEEEESLHSQEDFQENYINRSAIIIKPLQPFLDWYTNLNPNEDFEEEIKETNIYLIDETIDDIEKWLKKKFDKFFMMELDEWHSYKKEWPQKRSYKMFKLWFRVEISEMIYDLEKKPILKSE